MNKILDCKRHIHLFLSYFSKFDTDLRGENRRTWFAIITSCHSLICLTFSRSTVPYGTYGREGGQGEQGLRAVKPTWGGYRKNWMPSMLDRMLHQMAIEWIKSKQQSYGNLRRIDDTSTGIESERQYANHDNDDENNATDDIDDVLLGGTKESARGHNYVSYLSVENVRRDHERRLPFVSFAAENRGICLCYSEDNNYTILTSSSR